VKARNKEPRGWKNGSWKGTRGEEIEMVGVPLKSGRSRRRSETVVRRVWRGAVTGRDSRGFGGVPCWWRAVRGAGTTAKTQLEKGRVVVPGAGGILTGQQCARLMSKMRRGAGSQGFQRSETGNDLPIQKWHAARLPFLTHSDLTGGLPGLPGSIRLRGYYWYNTVPPEVSLRRVYGILHTS
jgi:hypothetical protein